MFETLSGRLGDIFDKLRGRGVLNESDVGVAMREVRDGDALYYLGEAPVNGQDTLTFEIEVVVEGEAKPMGTTFRQEFYPQ